jgi:hypothetical protein
VRPREERGELVVGGRVVEWGEKEDEAPRKYQERRKTRRGVRGGVKGERGRPRG